MKVVEHLKLNPELLKPNPINIQVYGEEEIDCRLVESIKIVGQLEAIVVTEDKDEAGTYIIISGHRRRRALHYLKLQADCILVEFADDLEMRAAIIDYNKQRKKLASQIVNEANLLRSIYAEQAVGIRKANLAQNADVLNSSHRDKDDDEDGRTRDRVARAVGMGWQKLERVTKIKAKADEGDEKAKILMKKLDDEEISTNGAYALFEIIQIANSDDRLSNDAVRLLEKAQKGEMSENMAFNQLNNIKKKRDIQPRKTDDRYRVVNEAERHNTIVFADLTKSHPLLEDIKRLDTSISSYSVLCLLTTTSLLKQSLDIMGWWGFEYQAMCIWDKEIKKSNKWFAGSHEVLLLSLGKQCDTLDIGKQFPGIIKDKKGHECVYEMLRQMFPDQRYMELFSTKEHEGWQPMSLELINSDTGHDDTSEEPNRDETIKKFLMGKPTDDTRDAFENYY